MKLNIFISSTCYDLSQIRSDIKDFIIELGHNPILSEDYSFPVDSSKNTVENCIETVRNYADLFILIIGNRYGYQIDGDKSITNTEFLTALGKNIPIYTFTEKRMINILPVWKDNPNGNYEKIVDTPKIFEFIEDVRNKYNLWNFEFERANDIKDVIKAQLSILLKKSLVISNQLKDVDTFFIENLSSKALKIMLEEKDSYEIFFFLQTFEDEISKYSFLKNDYIHSLKFASNYNKFDFDSFLDFTSSKQTAFINYLTSLDILIKEAFVEYYANPGIPSDLKGIFYISHKCGIIYQNILQWAIEFNSLVVDDELEELRETFTLMPRSMIRELEEFPQRERLRIQEAINKSKIDGEEIQIESTIKLRLDDEFNDKVYQILGKLAKRRGLNF